MRWICLLLLLTAVAHATPGVVQRHPECAAAWTAHQHGAHAEEIRQLDRALVLYPDDAALWAWRADAAGSPRRAVPFALTVKRMAPSLYHWQLPPPPKLPPAPIRDVLSLSTLADVPKHFDGLGTVHLPTTTRNPQVQAFFDQGLALVHAYVTPSNIPNSAARCFQYAINLDPDAPLPWWGLSFCTESQPLLIARHAFWLASEHGTDLEKRCTAARMLQLQGKQQAFEDALDGAIAAYPDTVELYVWRGKGEAQEQRAQEGVVGQMVYELAALRIDPQHPGANHELVHDYEAIGRPALGWPYAVALRKAAPNLPHAQHMEAHLAMRLGRWDDALEATAAAWEKAQQGYPELDPTHHLIVRIDCLGHQGMFAEAERIAPHGTPDLAWARLLRWKADDQALAQWAAGPAPEHEYVAALLALDRRDLRSVRHLLPLIQKAATLGLISRWLPVEVHARYLIASGHADAGFAEFSREAARSVNDASIHAFGAGGYFPEAWGEEALRRGRLAMAALAFEEALAHDQGSVIGALGLQIVAERRHQSVLAQSYAARAARLWQHADPGALARQLTRLKNLTHARAYVTIPWLRGLAA